MGGPRTLLRPHWVQARTRRPSIRSCSACTGFRRGPADGPPCRHDGPTPRRSTRDVDTWGTTRDVDARTSPGMRDPGSPKRSASGPDDPGSPQRSASARDRIRSRAPARALAHADLRPLLIFGPQRAFAPPRVSVPARTSPPAVSPARTTAGRGTAGTGASRGRMPEGTTRQASERPAGIRPPAPGAAAGRRPAPGTGPGAARSQAGSTGVGRSSRDARAARARSSMNWSNSALSLASRSFSRNSTNSRCSPSRRFSVSVR